MLARIMIFTLIGLSMIISGFLVLKKKKYDLIAGYTKGSVKNKEKYGKLNGIFLIIVGLITILFGLFAEVVNVGVYLACIFISAITQIILSNRVDKS